MNFINYGYGGPPRCNRNSDCPSTGQHEHFCAKLAEELARHKESRRAFYAEGGFHGHGR